MTAAEEGVVKKNEEAKERLLLQHHQVSYVKIIRVQIQLKKIPGCTLEATSIGILPGF